MSNEPETKTTPSPWDEIRRLADEVRLEVHLAGMELKDKWKALEPELHEVERKVKEAGTKAEGVIVTQLDAMATGLRKFADELREHLEAKQKA